MVQKEVKNLVCGLDYETCIAILQADKQFVPDEDKITLLTRLN